MSVVDFPRREGPRDPDDWLESLNLLALIQLMRLHMDQVSEAGSRDEALGHIRRIVEYGSQALAARLTVDGGEA